MDNNEIQLVGGPCGQHGPYTFYKAFSYTKNGVKRIMTLSEFFFVKLWIDSDLVCIGELQLLWIDKNSEQVLASLRLYFLPENTPEGRMDHGEDEVLAISEKVVLRVEDLITWITVDAEWTWGKLGKWKRDISEPNDEINKSNKFSNSLTDSTLDFTDVDKERNTLGIKNDCGPSVVILSYPRYCRYRAMMKRLEGVENEYLKFEIVRALGGFSVSSCNTHILFCRDTFDYPDLEGHELLCNHLAPKLKGRPRGKRKKRSISPGSESNESESSVTNAFSSAKFKITTEGGRNGLRCDSTTSPRRSTRTIENSESKIFLKKLFSFMKGNHTPIGRIPSLGYKELDLFAFFTKVQKLGGYDCVTTNRLWKSIFDDLSGNHNSTSAATVIRRHYERLLLAYERHIKGEEYKPLPVSERRRLKSKTHSVSDAETSEGTSRSGNSTPVPQLVPITSTPPTPPTPTENKEFTDQTIKVEMKPSSLRSVRVKPERLRDSNQKDKLMILDKSVTSTLENNNKIKSEPNEFQEFDIKPVNVSSTNNNNNNNSVCLPEKTSEPVTTAVAPIVLQKTSPDKSLSPVESKDDVPIISIAEAESANTKEYKDDLAVVPYKSKSPEIVKSETDSCDITITPNTSLLHEVKKRKLDILKEGGLEVTPVHNFTVPLSPKDIRPSVIHQTMTPMQSNELIVTSDKINMPPPSFNVITTKRNMNMSPCSPQTNSNSVNKRSPSNNTYVNGDVPPKVVQSKSIYSYSEKKVYGNPKDCFVPSVQPLPIHTPRFIGNNIKQPDILDLTVTSPQKPVVEIVRVPNVPPPLNLQDSHPKSKHKNSSMMMPLLEGRRLGSNLEITLVGPHNNNNNNNNHISKQMYPSHSIQNKYQMNHIRNSNHYVNNQLTQKRVAGDNYLNSKIPKVDDNDKSSRIHNNFPYTPSRDYNKMNGLEISVPSPYSGRSSTAGNNKHEQHMKSSPQNTTSHKQFVSPPNPPVPVFPPYMPTISNVKPYMPLLDPFYYSALQNLYSHNPPLPSVPPSLFPVPTPEQLQFYSDLMAHNARNRYPYPIPPDRNSSLVSSENNNKKQ